MEQGSLASCHMFGTAGKMSANLIPYGIYTIPEISSYLPFIVDSLVGWSLPIREGGKRLPNSFARLR